MSKKSKTRRQPQSLPESSTNPLGLDLEKLGQTLSNLAHQAFAEYSPLVDSIVRDKTTDAQFIERTLDGLLDFAFDAEVLVLFKKLCRYYDAINPAAVSFYVHAYRDLWDSD